MNSLLHTLRGAAVLLSLALPQLVFAQQDKRLQESRKRIESDPRVQDFRFNEQQQTPSMIMLKPSQGMKRGEAQTALASYLGVREGIDALQPGRTMAASGNIEVVEFAQYYRGVKVDRAGFKALVRNGIVTFFNGAWYGVPAQLSLQPSVDKSAALSRAKVLSGGRKFAWEELNVRLQRSTDSRERAALEKELAAVQPGGELVIVQDYSANGKAQPRLAWKFNVYAAEPLFRAWIYIDAQDGHTLLVDKIIKHIGEERSPNPPASVSATVQTRYAGTQVIKTKQISGNDPNSGLPLLSSHPLSEPLYLPGGLTYALIDDTRGGGIETYDLNGVGGLPISLPGLYLQGKSFTDLDNNWTLGEHKRSGSLQDGAAEAENDDIAWDAHWGAEVVYDYWLAKHNRLSYDGNNAKIKSFIHYGPAYDNAFWNGSVMTYGDGSGPTATGFKALTSLDVCGHEIGHGVCSYTADLVYASESGAMNEGLSDIWAACIEHFAMVRSGSTVPTGAYRPFYIGEQIGANSDAPLRRMDNPKEQGNPDTYGGANWVNPVCTPTLANDECGVHTNSGVINHWFFLLTAGSLNGTRPAGLNAAWYYRADSDDEMNDLGNSYRVNGVGFDQSEQVTFLMETMLSANATYAEARDVSIQVANSISNDPCSALTESVTNAWYAVGVGAAFVKPCTITYGFISKNGASVLEAGDASGCNAFKNFEVPVVLPAGGSATLTLSGTATNGTDYTVNTTTLTNSGTSTARQNFVVAIRNDASVEPDETIVMAIAVTNTGSSPVNNRYTITLIDDDVVPIIGQGQRTLLSESFTRADGFEDPAGWSEQLELREGGADALAAGKNQWGIFGNKLAITGREGQTNLVQPGGTYNSNSESQTIIRSPLLDSRGLSQLRIQFDYQVQGEVDVQSGDPLSQSIDQFPVFDYMTVAYSLDGVNYVELNTGDFHPFASVQPASGTFAANLPPNLTNKQFYLAFRWHNDTNGGGPVSVTVDNLLITGTPRRLENQVNQNSRETLAPNQESYFYSIADGELVVRAANNSTKDYGCTNAYVERAGNGSFNLYQGGGSLVKVSDKVVRIEPTRTFRAGNTVTLYYTEEQLANLETATGAARNNFKIYLVNAASYLQAASNNTTAYTPVYTALPGVGGSFTISFSNYLAGSYALGTPVTSFLRTAPVTTTTDSPGGYSFTPVYPNPGRGAAYLGVKAPESAKLFIEVRNDVGQVLSTQQVAAGKGSNNLQLKVDALASGNYRIQVRSEKGELLYSQNYFRN